MTMTIEVTRVLAALAVPDTDLASGWYAALFDRPADERPMDGLLEWHFAGAGVVQVVRDADRAGGSLLTLQVADLQAAISSLRRIGVEPVDSGDVTSTGGDYAVLRDPSANQITLVGRP